LDFELRRLRRKAAERDRAQGLSKDEVQRRKAARRALDMLKLEDQLRWLLQAEIDEARNDPVVMDLEDLAARQNLYQQ
jgi:hypothetical protein